MLNGDQLVEWEAFNAIDPIGSYKQDFQFAQLCTLVFEVAQAFSSSSKTRTTKILDFMPWWFLQYLEKPSKGEKPAPRQSVEEMKKVLLDIVSRSKKKKGGDK